MPESARASHVYSFEEVGPELDLLPLAARRALDCAGLRLPLDGWRSLSVEDRQRLALAGVSVVVDAAAVAAVVGRSMLPAERISMVSDPDPRAPPADLIASLLPACPLDGAVWSRLRPLDRYALVHAFRRALTRADPSILEIAVEAILRSAVGSSANPPSSAAPTAKGPSIAHAVAPIEPTDARADPDRAGEASPVASSPDSTSMLTVAVLAHPRADAEHARAEHARAENARAEAGASKPRKTMISASEPPPAMADPSGLSTHLDERGAVHMVDVGEKPETNRRAVASAIVRMQPETAARLANSSTPKGEVLATARVAGIMAAKRTPDLIPLCHAIALTRVAVEIEVSESEGIVRVTATAEARDRTGVEMEAMTAVSVACLTIYDMLKGIDRAMVISEIKLLEKAGGRSGHFQREHDEEGM
jgi:cyclic pyranopterin monophosphate synthase